MGDAPEGYVLLPKLPDGRSDFEDALVWAASYFDVAQSVEMGLDEGQRLTLAGIVNRLDQLEGEVALWPEGEPDDDPE